MGDSTRHAACSASRPAGKRAHADDDDETRASKVEAFSKWLAGVVPVHLVPGSLAEMLQHRANRRLDMARSQGVPAEHIVFGPDCLPTWASLCWDPEEESLHAVLQERLGDLGRALELDPFLQDEIRTKSNARMDEARRLGVPLDAIAVGPSLLPEWGMDPDAAVALSGGHGDQETDADKDNTPETGFAVDGPEPSHPGTTRGKRKRCSECSDPTTSDESSDGDQDDDQDDTGVIYLNNHVSPQPTYDCAASSHVLHDVQVVGAPDDASQVVDLEVYLAVGGDDDDDIAEVELAIDRAAYEACFGDDGAIDVHVPGADIFCFHGIEELDEDRGGKSREGHDAEERDAGEGEGGDGDEDEDEDEDGDGDVELEDSSDAHSEEE
ncbi:hypothetical protein E4U42_003678 [Claviceps africana]|uniref:Uncharacterized protein n=1 Tax=Claviceps africana TaxID=83212 RepID=A0A8K0J6H2_9HYPO|nr:hypothetical protein E4U42_003678 [Claviceps africana]